MEGFIATLGINPNKQPNEKAANRARKRAIFFYNRKTRFDMERHWAKKVNVCPFARQLDLADPETRCDLKENLAVRRWSILQFAATNRVELDIVEGKGKTKKKRNALHRLNANTIKALVALVEKHHAALEKKDKAAEPKRDDANDLIAADIAAVHGDKVKPSPLTKSDWNKSFYAHLWDLLLPTAANRKQRASLCEESAAKLFDIATANGTNFTPENVSPGSGQLDSTIGGVIPVRILIHIRKSNVFWADASSGENSQANCHLPIKACCAGFFKNSKMNWMEQKPRTTALLK